MRLKVSPVRKQPVSDDLTRLCAMIACLSGSGALGGAVGMARAENIVGSPFFWAMLFGLAIVVIIVPTSWYIVYYGSLFVLRRKISTSTLPWNKVMPVMFVILLISFSVSGCLGALLTKFFIVHVLS
jgi:hypothetical protein